MKRFPHLRELLQAMLTRGNPLHSKYINKAIKGLLANVSEDGKVMNVSGGTAVMRDKEGYRGIPGLISRAGDRDWHYHFCNFVSI